MPQSSVVGHVQPKSEEISKRNSNRRNLLIRNLLENRKRKNQKRKGNNHTLHFRKTMLIKKEEDFASTNKNIPGR